MNIYHAFGAVAAMCFAGCAAPQQQHQVVWDPQRGACEITTPAPSDSSKVVVATSRNWGFFFASPAEPTAGVSNRTYLLPTPKP